MTPETVLWRAWRIWLTLLLIPFLVLVRAIWGLIAPPSQPPDTALAHRWFVGSVAFMLVVVPAALFWRSRLFRGYWSGRPVEPRAYLRGMVTLWGALVAAGLLATVGSLVTRTLLPNLAVAAVAFVVFLIQWPNGHAMTRPVGDADDPEFYEEPR